MHNMHIIGDGGCISGIVVHGDDATAVSRVNTN